MENLNNTRDLFRKTLLSAAVLAGIGAISVPANAAALIGGMDGPAGYGELAMGRNDDGSSFSDDNPDGSLNLPFAINFFGATYSTFFINNNGNITFGDSDGSYTPEPFPLLGEPRIAPYWGDVDTRCLACGEVYVGAPNADTVAVTWNNVGYYSSHSNLTNNFQLLLRNQGGGPAGVGTSAIAIGPAGNDFDIEFRYDRLEWTTGDASGGSGGLGGTEAQAGFDAGDGINFFTLPGSQTPDVLELQNTSNVSPDTPGLWVFSIREGAVPGSTPENPIMPVVVDDSFNFDFGVILGQQVFIDPHIAIGYDYVVNSGPNFASVLLPDVGDGMYELWGGSFFDVFIDVAFAGVEYDFGDGGIDRFRVLGIEVSAGLDSSDTNAFITGLTFTDAGTVNMNQTPIGNIHADSVPEPASALLLLSGLGLISVMTMRSQRQSSLAT